MWNPLFKNTKYILDTNELCNEVHREITLKVIHARVQVYVKAYIQGKLSRANNKNSNDDCTRREAPKITTGKKRKVSEVTAKGV
jgi:hypothetical protein